MNIVVISSVVCGDNFSIPRMWFFMCIRMNPLSIYQIWTSPKYITYLPLWKLSKYSKCIPDTGYNNNTTTTIIHNNIQKTNKIIWLCGAWQAFYIHGIRLCMNKMKLDTCVGFGTIKRLNLRYIRVYSRLLQIIIFYRWCFKQSTNRNITQKAFFVLVYDELMCKYTKENTITSFALWYVHMSISRPAFSILRKIVLIRQAHISEGRQREAKKVRRKLRVDVQRNMKPPLGVT